jgi:hypothetical protein
MDAVNVKINGLVFDRANYDADGDVLYSDEARRPRPPTRRSPRRATASAATARGTSSV